jgi:tryptophan-rich sensory protein
MHPAILALLICGGAAALEGALAGRGVRARFDELRQPRFSPSLAVWFVIGAVYYLVCFVILYRLLGSDLAGAPHRAAAMLLIILMVANAGWGLLFFRWRHLRASFLALLPYSVVVVGLWLVLWRVDRTSALVLAPYVVYVAYAVWWSHQVWVLNRVPSPGGLTSA